MPTGRRLLRTAAAATAVGVVFGSGIVVGWLGWGVGNPRSGRSVLDQAEQRITTDAAHPVSKQRLERAAVEGMLQALDDKWSAYYSADDFQRFEDVLAGEYSGVGLWVRRAADGSLVVASVQADSPAAAAAVERGDELVGVDGAPVAGRTVADVVARLRGQAGSWVSLTVRRDGAERTLRLRRAPVSSDDVAVEQLGNGVVRLRVAAFTRGVGRWVREQVAKAESAHASGIVLDLRSDPGGLLDEAVQTASAFLSGGPVVSYQRRGSPPQVLDADGSGDTTIPLVVLVDGGTASAAEVVAAALQDRGRAVLIGSRTFGKGSVQEPSHLSDGSAIELTVGRYLTPSGHSLDGVGIEPDVQVPADAPDGQAEQRAVEVLSGMLADTGSAGRG